MADSPVSPGGDADPTVSRGRSRVAWILLAVIVLGPLLVRLRLLDVPFERDEGEYAYAGQLMLEGVPPFKAAYNMKLPGTYASYALSMAAFGETIPGARLGLILVNVATIVLVFLLGRRLVGTGGGLASAAAFAYLTMSRIMLGLFGHATHFIVLPAVAGALVLLVAAESRRLSLFFASGVLLGLALLMKQHAFVFPLFGVAWVAWTRLRERDVRAAVREGGALAAGVVVPVAITVLVLGLAGVLDRFYFWVILYAREYASTVPLAAGRLILADALGRIAAEHWGVLVLAGLGLVAVAHPRSAVRNRSFLVAFLAFSLLGIVPGLHFRGHYFIIALPAVALLVGAAYQAGERLLASRGPATARAVAAAVVAVACLEPVVANAGFYLSWPASRVSRETYGPNPFPEAVEIARYIEQRTRPDDVIAVIGSEPQIYFYANRRSATGHIYTYGLMELQPLAHSMQEEMIQQIETARPAYLVWVKVPTSWLPQPGSDRTIFEWASRYLPEHYRTCGTVAILGPERTDYGWDERAVEPPPGVPAVIVLRRNDFVPLR